MAVVNTTYPKVSFCDKGTVLYPYRRRLSPLSGHLEKTFMQQLKQWLPKEIRVVDDVCVYFSEGLPPLSPDIALFVEGHPEIRIDVEIDEPYEATTRKPIHYLTCGDVFRDALMNRHGWTVVRFAVCQVRKEAMGCADYLSMVISQLIAGEEGAEMKPDNLTSIPQWTRAEAQKIAHRKSEEGEGKQHDTTCCALNDQERDSLNQVKAFERTEEMLQKMQTFKDAGQYEQDAHIDFEPEEHIYIRDGKERLLPVSTLIAYFFEAFDALTAAERSASRNQTSVEETLDKWDKIGKMASEVGTFVHAQTENYFQHGHFDTDYPFTFNGETEHISVAREKQQFMDFIRDYHIEPYRQEWPVYDEELNIAGTIDLICKEADGTFTIYDWKRSGKVVNAQGQPIVEAFGYKMSFNGIRLPDTAFYHYCIQQNLYRYMLERHYGIKIKAMNLVVLCPEYPTYFVAEVPKMDEVIEQVVGECKKKDLGHVLIKM